MVAPNNIRIQRLINKVEFLQGQLKVMTDIADHFNRQLRAIHAGLGQAKYDELVKPVIAETLAKHQGQS